MGRSGRMFAIEFAGVEPDMMSVAKGIASGLPLGVALARADLMAWPPGAHASTFGGNPVSCAAALATITLLKDRLVANAGDVGARRGCERRLFPRTAPSRSRPERGAILSPSRAHARAG